MLIDPANLLVLLGTNSSFRQSINGLSKSGSLLHGTPLWQDVLDIPSRLHRHSVEAYAHWLNLGTQRTKFGSGGCTNSEIEGRRRFHSPTYMQQPARPKLLLWYNATFEKSTDCVRSWRLSASAGYQSIDTQSTSSNYSFYRWWCRWYWSSIDCAMESQQYIRWVHIFCGFVGVFRPFLIVQTKTRRKRKLTTFSFSLSIYTALYDENDRQKRCTFSTALHNNPLSDVNT